MDFIPPRKYMFPTCCTKSLYHQGVEKYSTNYVPKREPSLITNHPIITSKS